MHHILRRAGTHNEIYGSPFPNASGVFINDLKQRIRENYGHAGPKFIMGLLPMFQIRMNGPR